MMIPYLSPFSEFIVLEEYLNSEDTISLPINTNPIHTNFEYMGLTFTHNISPLPLNQVLQDRDCLLSTTQSMFNIFNIIRYS